MNGNHFQKKGLPVLAVTQAEAIKLIRSSKIFKRALAAGELKPVIQVD